MKNGKKASLLLARAHVAAKRNVSGHGAIIGMPLKPFFSEHFDVTSTVTRRPGGTAGVASDVTSCRVELGDHTRWQNSRGTKIEHPHPESWISCDPTHRVIAFQSIGKRLQ